MKYLSICSGIEAASTAWEPLGWKAQGFSEIEPFPSAVLAHHWPDVPNLGDMTKFMDWPPELLAEADILAGGTPCQAFSVAGLRQSLKDDRGNLSLTYLKLLDLIDEKRNLHGRPPAICLWENVPGVLNTSDNAFGCFLGGLAGSGGALEPPDPDRGWEDAGYVRGPRRSIAWRCLDAQYFGLAQRRKRVFVVGSAREEFRPEQILFECESVRRDTPPSRQTGERPAPTISARTKSGGGLGTDFDCDGGLIHCAEVETVDAKNNIDRGDSQHLDRLVTHSLRGEGFDASEDGTGRGTPLTIVHGTQDPCTDEHVAFALGRNNGGENAIAFDPRCARTTGGQPQEELNHCLRADNNSGDGAPCVAIAQTMQVRRLTPTECERLQGFSPDHTLIPWRGKPANDCPDGPRYKAIGNSMAVPCMAWIGLRIQMIETNFPPAPMQGGTEGALPVDPRSRSAGAVAGGGGGNLSR